MAKKRKVAKKATKKKAPKKAAKKKAAPKRKKKAAKKKYLSPFGAKLYRFGVRNDRGAKAPRFVHFWA